MIIPPALRLGSLVCVEAFDINELLNDLTEYPCIVALMCVFAVAVAVLRVFAVVAVAVAVLCVFAVVAVAVAVLCVFAVAIAVLCT